MFTTLNYNECESVPLRFPLHCIIWKIWPSIEFTAWSFTNVFGKTCHKNFQWEFNISQEYIALPWNIDYIYSTKNVITGMKKY